MKWLARLKKIETATDVKPTKPTKPGDEPENRGFVGFVGPLLAPVQKAGSDSPAANDGNPDPDRYCRPHSTAMNAREIDAFTARLARFTDKGLSLEDGEALANSLVMRDRESDDRRLCLECTHLGGTGAWRCGNWQRAGVAIKARDAGLPRDLVRTLQRCDGFSDQYARVRLKIENNQI